MTDKERIEALGKELSATRQAAIQMMVGMALGIASTPEGREELAEGFRQAGEDEDPILAGLARDVAEAIRAAVVVE